ncbi:MAG: peptidoglycan DD-metalloendopeptidase family protein [Sphingobacteriaceae bacterium]|nr:peptidoglycan DD-metalloendopeptidase family protein [Sphingobacteriaceae bacterium]
MKKLRYRKNDVSRIICLLLFFTCLSLTLPAQTKTTKDPKKDLENKKKKINEEINEINIMLNATKANKKNSLGNLLTLNMKLDKRQELIAAINAEIIQLNKKINFTETEIDHLRANLEKLKAEYARMIISAQRQQDAYSRLMFLFSSSNFNQALMRLKYLQQYSVYRKKQADEIVATQSQLQGMLVQLKESKHEKNVLLGNEEAEKDSLSQEKAEQEIVLNSLQQKEKDLKTKLERKKQESVELQLAIKKLIADEIKRKAEEAAKEALAAKKAKEEEKKKNKEKNVKVKEIAKTNDTKEKTKETPTYPELSDEAEALSNDFANNRGKLPWPITKGIICEPYGEHEHPAIKGFMMMNNGVEICSGKGATARAIFDGEVTSVAVSPTGGKLVIIRHGEYLSVYTNLSDVQVKVGEKIKLKQPIGTVMMDEDETKAAMNFQIWKGQKTMDPSGWLYRGG